MTARHGTDYFFQGFSLIQTKGLKRFVLIPLAVNLLLFGCAFYWLYLQMDLWFAVVEDHIPSWLSWLTALLWPLALISIVIIFSYLFSLIANWIAAPFNGLLAEKVEVHLTGRQFSSAGLSSVVKDLPRTLSREWIKLIYYIPRAIGFLLLLLFIPVIGPVLWFLFTAWMMAIQYCDYAFDNHRIDFDTMRQQLNRQKGLSISFGTMATLFSMIPVVNLIVMPVAICGATAMWVERFK